MGKSKTLNKNGQRTGLTRNQQRKLDYARAAEVAAKERGGPQVVSGGGISRATGRTNHAPGPGRHKTHPAQHGLQRVERAIRRKEAEARNAAYQALTLAERVKRLDTAFGKGVGAVRERARIAALVAAAAAKAAVPVKPQKQKK